VDNVAEIFANPADGAIIEKVNEGVTYILVQERCKTCLKKGTTRIY
jgi:hypothetical protein